MIWDDLGLVRKRVNASDNVQEEILELVSQCIGKQLLYLSPYQSQFSGIWYSASFTAESKCITCDATIGAERTGAISDLPINDLLEHKANDTICIQSKLTKILDPRCYDTS